MFDAAAFAATVVAADDSDPAIVDVRLASNAATASGDKVCENDKGGNGTDPGAGEIRFAGTEEDVDPAPAAVSCLFAFSTASFIADTAAAAATALDDDECGGGAVFWKYDCCAHSSAMFVRASNASTWTAGRSCKFSHVRIVGIQFCS